MSRGEFFGNLPKDYSAIAGPGITAGLRLEGGGAAGRAQGSREPTSPRQQSGKRNAADARFLFGGSNSESYADLFCLRL